MSYKTRREEGEHGKSTITVYWDNERGGTFDQFSVVRTGDRCVSIKKEYMYFYDGEELYLLVSALALFAAESMVARARQVVAQALVDRTHAGPRRAICAECGDEIGAYESRRYGDTGAVHIRKDCWVTGKNESKYPNSYSDG